jgi:hypothetical protein
MKMLKKQLFLGILLATSFLITLGFMLSPAFDGKNFVAYADEHFDSYSKHSSYFIPELIEMAKNCNTEISISIDLKSEEVAKKVATLYAEYGKVEGSKLKINARLSDISLLALKDADRAYYNDESYFKQNYGMSAKEVLYYWHSSLQSIAKALKAQGKFEESLFIENQILMRGIEPAYNFFGLEAKPIDIIGAGLLVFYVIYTLWWGFAIYLLFEGLGIKVTKPKSKKEV